MKIYKMNYFNGGDLSLSLLYTSKKSAMADFAFFKSGDFTDVWMMVYIPDPNEKGCLKIESNELIK